MYHGEIESLMKTGIIRFSRFREGLGVILAGFCRNTITDSGETRKKERPIGIIQRLLKNSLDVGRKNTKNRYIF